MKFTDEIQPRRPAMAVERPAAAGALFRNEQHAETREQRAGTREQRAGDQALTAPENLGFAAAGAEGSDIVQRPCGLRREGVPGFAGVQTVSVRTGRQNTPCR